MHADVRGDSPTEPTGERRPELDVERWTFVDRSQGDETTELARDVRAGLTRPVKRLSCRFLYDAEGSRLFEAICEQPEYYLTRAEEEILQAHADEIVALAPGADLIELGSGSARKTRLLLDARVASRTGARATYAPIDVSREALVESSAALLARCPSLQVVAVAGTYEVGLRHLSARRRGTPWLVAWLGSSIGNLSRAEARRFLVRLRRGMAPGDRLLLGIDLRKERAVLEAAYDDAEGVTARFNRNILRRINRELGGRFDVETFAYRARYRERAGRVEMHLVSRAAQRVRIDALALEVAFHPGEAIFTERSVKYSPREIDALATASGFRVARRFTDERGSFRLNLLE